MPHVLPVQVEVGPDVLIPRAIVTRADATCEDDVASMESQVNAVPIHLGCHVQSRLARRRTFTARPAVTQGDESEPQRGRFERCGAGDR